MISDAHPNPLLHPPERPYNSVPFEAIQVSHYLPALEASMKDALEQLDAIASSSDEPSFANTIEALESISEDVDQVSRIYFNLFSSEADDEHRALAQEISPMLTEFGNDILLNDDLFKRVEAVYESEEAKGLGPEPRMLLEKTFRSFVRNGARLSAEDKETLRGIDNEIAGLVPQFSDNVLKATNAFEMVLGSEEELDGLPETARESFRANAVERGREDAWIVTLDAPSYIPFMTYSNDRRAREQLWRAYASRAYTGPYDNCEILLSITRLRHERARLLGYDSHADFVLQERMAQSAGRVLEFLERLRQASYPAAEKDLDALRDLMEKETGNRDLKSWDVMYYSEKLKQERYQLDQEILRPYFKLENTIDGAFEHARRLFGLEFVEAEGVEVYHPDVKVFEVLDSRDQSHIGLFYMDFFPRPTKQNGAWMTVFKEQGLHRGKVERPHVSIVCNFTKPTPEKPSLLTFDEVTTLFHEFGHALHTLLTKCTYTSLSGCNVYWDFVELPSQIMENWILNKESLDLFAKHFEDGHALPTDLADRIKESARFMAGSISLRQLNFGFLDMAWHAADPSGITDVEDFETAATEKTRVLEREKGVCSSPAFSHIFAGGYSAGYYSYKWAEVLDADAFEAFTEAGLFNKDVADKFRSCILEKGGTEHPMSLYKSFRGREPDPDALLRRDGLLTNEQQEEACVTS